MKKHILSAAAFLLILSLLIAGASCVVRPKNNTAEAGMQYDLANGILAEPKNTIDVVFLGNSLSYCSFIPMEIWRQRGIPAYVCATVPQRMYTAEEYLHRAFKNQSPKIVVLEALAVFEDYGNVEVIPEKAAQYIPLLRYHNRWKSLRKEDWYLPVRYTNVRADKGNREFRDIVPVVDSENFKPMEGYYEISSKNMGALRQMRDFCKENGAQLVIACSPSLYCWSPIRQTSVRNAAEQLDVPFLNFNQDSENVDIDWNNDTLDAGDHINLWGAIKVSDYMGDWLADTGLFTDKRDDPAYTQWNTFLAEYEANLPEEN